MIKLGWVERALMGLLLVVAALIVVHAPLTVWAGTQWPDYVDYIKAWKELLMGAALVLLIVVAVRRKMVGTLLNDRLMQLAIVYAGLHFVMVAVFQNGLQAAGAGLLIDLRYVLYFVLVYGTARLIPQFRQPLITATVGGAVVVLAFALLQMFVLPKDFLANIGYSKETISPYLTVDDNPAYIRINSTLRGPNPLGAYAVIIISLLTAAVIRWKTSTRGGAQAGVAAVVAGLTLSASYSRSAVIGALAAIVTVAAVALPAKMRKRVGIIVAVGAVVAVAAIISLRDSPFVSNVVLHNSPTTGAEVDSNEGHADSLIHGLSWVGQKPFGAGIGSTGSASLNGPRPFIVENQYLFIAHEVGWLGLALFVWLYVEIMRRLWQRRRSVLALGVFGSGVGLAVIGLLLPVWVDDTVSIVWWGLAGVAIGYWNTEDSKRKKKKQHA